MKSTSGKLLDEEAWRDFVELWSDDESAAMAELLNDFLDDAQMRVEEIQEGLNENQSQRVERAAHSLKSCSASFGAMRLSDLCRQIEKMAREQVLNEAAQAAPALREALDATRQALLQELARQRNADPRPAPPSLA